MKTAPGATLHHSDDTPGLAARRRRSWAKASLWPASIAAATAAIMIHSAPGGAQPPLPPTSPTTACPDASPPFVMPAEIVSSGGILKGTINLTDQQQRLPKSIKGTVTCAPQIVRIFQAEGAPAQPPAPKPDPNNLPDPIAGPTLRAKVGDVVQLTFVNQVNSNRFDRNIDLDACMRVGQGGAVYPGTVDVYPNCLHASSTANIHFHGTHTNPNTTGDSVFLQIRPLPRNNQGNLTVTPAAATVALPDFFGTCFEKLKNPLNQWPVTWDDLPKPWTDKQWEMLKAYETQNPNQPLWTIDQQMYKDKVWPIYYIGAFPYCFALPAYTLPTWPPPPGSTSPNMGQSPGTHWYHAHKHGSTAINVGNGMTGAFIIEGKDYDGKINESYGSYVLKDGKPWNTSAQPILVLNQLETVPNILAGGGQHPLDFVVNGRLRPKLSMQLGEVQLWRIINTSARSAAYFMAPTGVKWRQLAQDGVQLADWNYRNSENVPLFLAPGNRVDLLVQAPTTELTTNVLIQNVMGRASLQPSTANPGTALLTVEVKGPPVQPSAMQFLPRAPQQPPFLTDITDQEWARSNYAKKELTFDSKGPGSKVQHTINGVQFADKLGQANVSVTLSAVEEWTIKNTTPTTLPGPSFGPIDHPFHIHINPFQITEVFDPNENMTDPKTGQLILDPQDSKKALPQYFVLGDKTRTQDPRQCVLDPSNSDTWKPCQPAPRSNLVWWDVFAIPSGRQVTLPDGKTTKVIPGYFKMRSRFVDYAGNYVLHCHILVHEDRGMMFTVQVIGPTTPPSPPPPHH